MVKGFYYCCDFLYTAASAWLMLTLASAVWRPKAEGRARKMIWVAAVVLVAGHNTVNNSIIAVLFSETALMTSTLLLALASILICHCRYRDAVCLIYLFLSTLALADFFLQTLIYTIRRNMGLRPALFLTTTVLRGIYLLLWGVALLVAVHFVRRHRKEIQVETSRYLRWGWCLVFSFFVSTVYFQRIYKQLVSEQFVYRWWLFLLGGMLLALAGLAHIVVRRERERYRLLQQKTEMLEYDYKAMQKENREREILLHDIRKHRMAIREMAETGRNREIVRYLDEMEKAPQRFRNRDLVNHELLNLILNWKFQEAEELGIGVQYELSDMSGLLLSQMEVCAFFSNILDNALEANQALAEGKERWIKLDCARRGRMLVITESNPMPEGRLRFLEGIPQTTKKEKRKHGLGMQSIRQIVDSYEGEMQIDAGEGIFQLTIYLEGF